MYMYMSNQNQYKDQYKTETYKLYYGTGYHSQMSIWGCYRTPRPKFSQQLEWKEFVQITIGFIRSLIYELYMSFILYFSSRHHFLFWFISTQVWKSTKFSVLNKRMVELRNHWRRIDGTVADIYLSKWMIILGLVRGYAQSKGLNLNQKHKQEAKQNVEN